MRKLATCSIAGLDAHPDRLAALCALWRAEQRAMWLTLQGGSMTPTILPGRRIRLLCTIDDVSPNQVIVYRQGDRLIVHRLLSIETAASGGRKFICLGDGNYDPDDPVAEEDVVGVVTEVSSTPFLLRIAFAAAHPVRHVRFFKRAFFSSDHARPS